MKYLLINLFVISFAIITSSLDDPYKVLGIHKSSTLAEIRKAYKQLAKEWHPDKNDNPAAEDKFVEISKAYELLTDPERRKLFDTFGRVEEARPRAEPQYKTYDPFDDIFASSGFKFRFSDRDITLFHKLTITSRFTLERTIDIKNTADTKLAIKKGCIFGLQLIFILSFISFVFGSILIPVSKMGLSVFGIAKLASNLLLAYENNIIPKSFKTPHLILFYSDWCFPCLKVEPVWRRIMEELEPVGIGIATVHAENEKSLARKVGIPALPSLILVSEGRARLYKESLFSVQKVVEFVRHKLPYKLVQEVNDDNFEDFLAGWSDNKVRALVFQRTQPLRLRYLLTAFYHKDRVAFGHVTASERTEKIRSKYQISSTQDALLVFNEMIERPAASVTMADIPVHTMHDVINTNYYLLLPRLSSQALLDALCPPGVSWSRKRICVVLVCQDTPSHDPHRESLRRFASESRYSKERVRFMYVYQERQPQFVSALTAGDDSPMEPMLHVALLCRRDESHVKYEWLRLEEGEDRGWDCYNDTKQQLEAAIDRVLYASSQQVLSKEAVIQDLIDEQTQGLIGRLFSKVLITMEILQDSLGKEHVLPAVSVLATVIVIITAGHIINYLMKMEEAKFESQGYTKKGSNGMKTGAVNGYTPELKIHDMRAETYNALVHLLRPGCRTILLLCDTQSKPKLLPKFHKYVWPYRKNKALMFATLNLDRGLGWYSELLGQSLSEPRKLNINPRNCVGTVLALNGMRKYFCVYHAKHPEGSNRANGRMRKIVSRQLGVDPAGAFMGFDDSTSESELSDIEQGKTDAKYEDVIFLDQLLDGLPNWLDRLFEGTTHRYYLNYWPDFVTKK